MLEIYLCVNEQRQSALLAMREPHRHAHASESLRSCLYVSQLMETDTQAARLGHHYGRLLARFAPAMAARNRASFSRNSISARLRLVMSTPVPQYPVKVPASS
jgi:hypothetical protein